MKLKRDQQRWIDHLREHCGVARGMTLGRGRPHDRRVLQQMIDVNLIKPILNRTDPLQNEYAVRGEEDEHGLALFVCPTSGVAVGATCYGVLVRAFDDHDYERDTEGTALENGIDTAWECYPEDGVRREWMQWAAARSTLAMKE